MAGKSRKKPTLPCIYCEHFDYLGALVLSVGKCQELGGLVEGHQILCRRFKRFKEKRVF